MLKLLNTSYASLRAQLVQRDQLKNTNRRVFAVLLKYTKTVFSQLPAGEEGATQRGPSSGSNAYQGDRTATPIIGLKACAEVQM